MDAVLGINGCGDRRLWRREDGEDSVSGGEVLVCGFRQLVGQSWPGGSI